MSTTLQIFANVDSVPVVKDFFVPTKTKDLHPVEHHAELPSIEKFIHIVNKYRALKCFTSAKQIHAWICSQGLENHSKIGCYVVPMFVECGSINDAQHSFNKLQKRNEHSWTSLIVGYIDCGMMHLSFDLYEGMIKDQVPPSQHTLMALLRASSVMEDMERGQVIHSEILQQGLENVLSIGNSLINMYAKCGFLIEAYEVFAKMPVRDVVSWTTLISGNVENGCSLEALKCFDQMKLEGTCPSSYTYVCALRACTDINWIQKGQELHSEIRHKGLDSNLFVASALVDLYAKCGLVSDAWEAFSSLSVRDAIVWTSVIAGFADNGHASDALDCFNKMQKEGISPTPVTYSCLLKSCGSSGAVNMGYKVHAELELKGFHSILAISNSLIAMYGKFGFLSEAQHIFDKLAVKDVVSWNTIITGYCEHGPQDKSIYYFNEMLQKGVSPNAVTFLSVLKACSTMGDIDMGREIQNHLVKIGLETDVTISNTLVAMYAKCGRIVDAKNIFDKLGDRTVVSWNAMIAGYTGNGSSTEAFKVFQQMKCEQVSPDNVTYCCLLKACGSAGALNMGNELHLEVKNNGLIEDPSVFKSLIGMYAECGSLTQAKEMFHQLPVQDAAAWSSMIRWLGINHEGKSAIQFFEDMKEQGVKPDAVTFTCLIAACSQTSLVNEGYDYFKSMREKYGISPGIEHFNCVINLISRSGHLFEAERFIEMLSSTSEEMWAALLTACRTYGEVELGLRCFQQLIHINPEDSAWYVLMEDIYASAGQLSNASKIEQLRKRVGARKKPAVALIEVDKKVHEFVVGEEQGGEVLSTISDMRSSLKSRGHIPHLDKVLGSDSDDSKEASLYHHAEKLAIAFGLVSTPQGTTLRVSKNLRMCFDCHNTAKIISTVEKREIIIRDSSCIHHFKDNVCSCGDTF